MDRRLRNRILIFLLLAGIAAIVLISLSGRQPVAKISAVIPVRENIVASLASNGKVEPISPFVMRAQLDTFVEKVSVQEGQSVKKGQLLIALNVKDAAAQLAEARSKLLRAEDDLRAAKAGGRSDQAAQAAGLLATATAQRDRLQRNHDTLTRLIAQQAATKDELAANDVELAKAQAEVTRLAAAKQEFERDVQLDAGRSTFAVQQGQSEVAALEEKVRSGRITAPADGTLYSLPIKTGDFVKTGDLLAEMADLHKVRVRAFIDEPELGVLEPGQQVRITWDALPNRTWTGKTEVIPKQVVARGARSVGELLCTVNNDNLELLPNINVNVRINSQERSNVLTVPRGSVASDGNQRFVYVVKHNELSVNKSRLERREIRVGIADSTNYEVTSGLQENEMIALPGDIELKDGMVVRVMNTDASRVRGRSDAN
ncbi:MAG TPA: efflux RND transporter periplasmic adaptor subunit [Candidatus Eisenbacteria bacterium]|nr:efflux RND transporter periplasmic adaptor subunit [Candidatus Eisenbacteria bacterium]